MARILIVDDDESICSAFKQFLERKGHVPIIVSNASDALENIEQAPPDLVFLDIRMPGTDGLEALERIRQVNPDVSVVIMTAYGTSQTSIESMRLGAYEYLTKPLDLDVVRVLIDKALEAKKLSREVEPEADDQWAERPLVFLAGKSPAMQEAYKLIGLVAAKDLPVLIGGERGVGKESVARTIHANSRRKARPFVAVHCREVTGEHLEAEIFGREAAAGGGGPSQGRLEAAAGGSLFLDDVDTLPLPLQSKILRYLSDGSFERSGGFAPIRSDARVLAATEKDLEADVRTGVFSEALFNRLTVVSIHLPPLRERGEDIPELAAHFLRRCSAEFHKAIKGIDDRAMKRLLDYSWPGNVAQLENVIKRASVLTRSAVITPDHVTESLEAPFPLRKDTERSLELAALEALRQRLSDPEAKAAGSAFRDIVGRVEQALVREALTITAGNQLKAAELLGLNRATLRKRLRS